MRKSGVFKCVLALVLVLALIGTISVSALAEDKDDAPVFVTQSTTEPTSENENVEVDDKTPLASAKAELSDVSIWDDLGKQSPISDEVVPASHDVVGTVAPIATVVIVALAAGVITFATKKKEG